MNLEKYSVRGLPRQFIQFGIIIIIMIIISNIIIAIILITMIYINVFSLLICRRWSFGCIRQLAYSCDGLRLVMTTND